MGQIFVVSAPSGAGKTTVCRQLLETVPDLTYSVSYTTRPPRPGEAEGQDYFFVPVERFEAMIGEDAFLEHARVFDRYYGTGRDWVKARLAKGVDVLVDVDVEGARQIKSRVPDAVGIFIVPPTFEDLGRRLNARRTESEEEMKARLDGARREIAARSMYDYLVVNDRIDQAVADLSAIIRAERLRMGHYDVFWKGFFCPDRRSCPEEK